MIRSEQSKRVERAMPKDGFSPAPQEESRREEPGEFAEPFVRSGAQWDYAIESGMTPDEAEAFLRQRGG